MRKLFIVGAKLIGLAAIWWVIFTTLQIMSYAGLFFVNDIRGESNILANILYAMGLIAYFVLGIWFAYILLFRTEWLAGKVGITDDSEIHALPKTETLLKLGIILLGIYVLSYSIPGFVKTLLGSLGMFLNRTSGFGDVPGFFTRYMIPLFSDLIGLAIGFVLVIMPQKIIRLIENTREKLELIPKKAEE